MCASSIMEHTVAAKWILSNLHCQVFSATRDTKSGGISGGCEDVDADFCADEDEEVEVDEEEGASGENI